MKTAFEAKRKKMMLFEKKSDVSQIPIFRVKTPLQAAIQILKHHRNQRFADEPEIRPSSIVVTTLAAAAYGEEATITGSLFSILSGMDRYIQQRAGEYWIPNPSDPRENFADSWKGKPEYQSAFYEWLETARADFGKAAEQNDVGGFVDVLSPRMGRSLMEKAASKRNRGLVEKSSFASRTRGALQEILDAPHRKPIAWPRVDHGPVKISASSLQSGFRPKEFQSDGPPLPKRVSLTFVADTQISRPFKVFWQVVNTGAAAKEARSLRGGFEEIEPIEGKLTKHESTLYTGVHSVECFIVKGGYCVAWSGPFIVDIA